MTLNIGQEVARLQKMAPKELRARYEEVFGEPIRTGNKAYLVKRIAWRLQADAEGDLTERARRIRRRAKELAHDSDIRVSPPKSPIATIGPKPKTVTKPAGFHDDDRLPMVGQVITRPIYKGREIVVTVKENGFEYDGETYRSLSAVAKAVTGTHCNGFAFFNLNKNRNAK
jgi:hypothetical protein